MEEDKTKKGFKEKFVGIIKKNWMIILILLLLCGWFYWFQWRPAEIRKKCFKEVKDYAKREGEVTITEGERYYQKCLVENGMKSETLFREVK